MALSKVPTNMVDPEAATKANLDAHTADPTDAHAGTAITNTPSGNLAAITVQDALNELQTDVDTRATSSALSSHESDTTSIHGITDTADLLTTNNTKTITNKTVVVASNTITTAASGNLAAVELNAALAELQTDIDTRATLTALTDHTGDATDAHDASAISFAAVGTIAATDAQAAIAEVATDAASALSTHEADTTSIHGITDTSILLTTTGAQVVTAKDIDGGTASNTSRITIPKNTKANLDALTRKEGTIVYATDTDKFYSDDGSTLTAVGSGAGGDINFITNGDGATGVTGWTEGSYSAATRPAGTFTASSGTGTLAISSTSTVPLGVGLTSLLLTKSSGASRQGRAVEYEFDLPIDYRAKVLSMDIHYIINSGTFVAGSSSTDSSLIYYTKFYDGSTWTIQEPSSFKCLSTSTTISDRFRAEVQTPYNATKMRLIAYVAESANSAWEVKATFAINPSKYVYGTPITNPTAYTPTLNNFGNGVGYLAWERRGARIKIQGTLVVGSSLPTGEIQFLLPSSLTADFTTIPKGIANSDAYQVVGIASGYSPNFFDGFVARANTSTNTFYIINGATYGGSAQSWQNTIPATWSAGDAITVDMEVPILGWSSSVQTSDQTDTRVVAALGTRITNQTISTTSTTLTFPGTTLGVFDTHGAFNTATGIYTVIVPGMYVVAFNARIDTGGSAPTRLFANITNNVQGDHLADIQSDIQASENCTFRGSTMFNCKVGEQLSVNITSETNSSTFSSGDISIHRISGPSAIAATESISASYYLSANFAASATVPINYDTKLYDSHGMVVPHATTWKATAPISGKYRITLMNVGNAVSVYIILWKNGAEFKRLAYANWGSNMLTQSCTINLVAGDYFEIRPSGALTATGGTLSAGAVWIDIERVGN